MKSLWRARNCACSIFTLFISMYLTYPMLILCWLCKIQNGKSLKYVCWTWHGNKTSQTRCRINKNTWTIGHFDFNQSKLTSCLNLLPLSFFFLFNLFVLSRKRENPKSLGLYFTLFLVFFLSYCSLTRVALSPSFGPLSYMITLMWGRSSHTNLCLPSHMSYPLLFLFYLFVTLHTSSLLHCDLIFLIFFSQLI